jgi:hypothetical protein
LTLHLKADTLAIFLDDVGREALKGERMLSDPDGGNFTILDYIAPCLTGNKATGHLPLATPLLIYAELLHDSRPREMETANMVYERFVAPLIGHE